MMNQSIRALLSVCLFMLINNSVWGQNLKNYKQYQEGLHMPGHTNHAPYQFNGYTNHWHDIYSNWYMYGNLFKMAVPDVEKSILQAKIEIAEDMGVPGLIMQEGFMEGLLSGPFKVLDQPAINEIESDPGSGNLLIFVDPLTETGKMIQALIEMDRSWPAELKSHQYGASELHLADAVVLENEGKKIFVISASDAHTRNTLRELVNGTIQVMENHDLHKGWFGAETLLKSVTCTDGHPLEVIGRGMNEGCDWFVFSGYMDFLAKEELEEWVSVVDLPVVTDVGFWPIYGCRDYEGLQVQSLFTKESWIDYARKKDGYVFREVWDTLADPLEYDGYLAVEGNKDFIDNEEVPFILNTGQLDDAALNSMMLFVEKGKALTRQSMWEAILSGKATGIMDQGKMTGPSRYRHALQMLLLDRTFLENYFRDQISLFSAFDGYTLEVTVMNHSGVAVSGNLDLTLPEGLRLVENLPVNVALPPGGTKTHRISIMPDARAMAKANPVKVRYKWAGREKTTLTMLDLPPAISVHRLLYGHAPKIEFPVTLHNFTKRSSFPVDLQVMDAEDNKSVVFKTSTKCETPTGTFRNMVFELKVPPGSYKVKVEAMGVEYISQLGVGESVGRPYVYELDLNSDGIKEYRMENDSVQITLLATGARVIEYIVKSRNDNVLFKLWPEKAVDDRRPFRKRGYYPYGGFEDFLGQGSMETHQVYEARIEEGPEDYVRVRMWTDYFGNRLEKTFTLYGNSPLLEVRFALTFKNPEANVLGPQPILVLGKEHWTEDVFTIPEMDGLHEYRMKPERYYGRIFHLKEGWNAGYDTKEDITFIGLFPVDQPLFLHMWMNHPRNNDAHHYYAEFQPWTPIFQKTTMYFTYYIWGMGGRWEHGVDRLRTMNLITIR